METWLRPVRTSEALREWDMMLKACSLEWQGVLRAGDRLDIDVAVSHWGRTSWTLDYVGSCGGQPVFTARIVYVSVALGTASAMETPQAVRDFLGEPVDLIGAQAP